MRRLTLAWLATLALLLPCLAAAQGIEELTAERAAIQRVLTGYANNVQTGNLAQIESLFAPGAHILTGSAALHSWAEYRDQYLQAELARFTNLRYTHSGVEATVRGNVAWANFRWQMAGSGDGPAPVLGRGTAVMEKIDGRWMLAVLHFSK